MDTTGDAHTESGDRTGSKTWDGFTDALTATLSQLDDDEYLVLELLREVVASDGSITRSDTCPFVQFAQGGDEGMRSEAVSNIFLSASDQLTAAQQDELIALGWLAPTYVVDEMSGDEDDEPGSPNYYRDWTSPPAYAEIAALAVRALVEVYGAASPSVLSYHASGPDGDDLHFEALGISPTPQEPDAPSEDGAGDGTRTRSELIDDSFGPPSVVTETIAQYRRGEITWDELVAFVKTYAWRDPVLPDALDYNGWDAIPDTFQPRTWGEVTGAHIDELLTEDEYFALTDVFDALPLPHE